MEPDYALGKALANRQLSKSAQILTGIITGIVADGTLNDLEIMMLNTWLAEHPEVASVWPGSLIGQQVQQALSKGTIAEEQRERLLLLLQQVIGTEFSETGAVSPEVAALPFDEATPVNLRDNGVCLTGEFDYGTRARCQQVTEQVGGITYSSVSKKISYLVVGTHVSPSWVGTSYGQKIMKAMALKEAGHPIAIIHERRWADALRL